MAPLLKLAFEAERPGEEDEPSQNFMAGRVARWGKIADECPRVIDNPVRLGDFSLA